MTHLACLYVYIVLYFLFIFAFCFTQLSVCLSVWLPLPTSVFFLPRSPYGRHFKSLNYPSKNFYHGRGDKSKSSSDSYHPWIPTLIKDARTSNQQECLARAQLWPPAVLFAWANPRTSHWLHATSTSKYRLFRQDTAGTDTLTDFPSRRATAKRKRKRCWSSSF